MSVFEDLWLWTTKRAGGELNVVQDRSELEHIFNLMKNRECTSYLEVGSAEGGSLYVLSRAMKEGSKIVCIDYGEDHTQPLFHEVLDAIHDKYNIKTIYGDSHSLECKKKAQEYAWYDCVLIDAGHKYADVVEDALAYGAMAKKFIFFHDVQLPEVKQAFDWYCSKYRFRNVSTFINSSNYGYGIIEK